MRDVKKTAEAGRKILQKRDRLDLSINELNQFYEAFEEEAKTCGVEGALFHLIGDAYKMGLAVGMRNA